MSIRVEIPPDEPGPPYERCAFCRAPTNCWTADREPKSAVAVCRECAANANPWDVPSKKTWCRRERIADHRRKP